ncbi:hypothetical protein K8W59_15930 [Nocardioides rotundus]|uniref:hypothetical protein n=1 Tax=Nocardioides rotundus TaxID=1774216 RepID=UPI001CC0FDF3|nr:hypothetical protein [Nocardioides rotundus]UAL29245.1 hypothetical protein K8W59_15930 [Nocardioides rotundus]
MTTGRHRASRRRPGIRPSAIVLLLVLLCSGATVAAGASSAWLRTSADDLARGAFDRAGHTASQLQVDYTGVDADGLPAGGGAEVRAAISPQVRRLLSGPRAVAMTNQQALKILPARSAQPSYLSVAGFPEMTSLVDLVSGRQPRPGATVRRLPDAVARDRNGPATAAVVEVLIHEETAKALDLPVGSWAEPSSSSLDLSPRESTILRVVGTFRPRGEAPTALDDVPATRAPSISVLPEVNLVRATALAADPETVFGATWPQDPMLRYSFDLARPPDAEAVPGLVEQLRRTRLQSWPEVVPSTGASAATGLADTASGVVTSLRASDGVLTLVLSGVASGLLVVLWAAALLLVERRQAVLTVMRARGASTSWLGVRAAVEAVLWVLPGLLLVGLAAALPGPVRLGDLVVAAAAALACVAVITVAQAVPASTGLIRTVLVDALQLVVVVLAVGGVLLVWADDSVGARDPIVLALPVLIGTATAVIAVRLLGPLLIAVGRTAARGRSLVGMVALAQAGDVVRRTSLACVAAVLALATGVLALAADDTLEAGAERAGWETAVADVSVRSSVLRADALDRVGRLPGAGAVVPVLLNDQATVETPEGLGKVQLIAADTARLQRVLDPAVGDLEMPRPRGDVLEVVASPGLQLDGDSTVRFTYGDATIRAVDRVDGIPGLTGEDPFLIVDLDAMGEATGRAADTFDLALVSGDPDPAAVARIVRERDPQAEVLSRSRITEEALSSPAVQRTRRVLMSAALAGGVLGLVALTLVVVLGGPARRRTSGVLSTLGTGVRDIRRAAALAIVPVVGAVALAAAVAGVALAVVAGHAFDPAALAAPTVSLPVRLAPLTLLALVVALVLVTVATALLVRPRRPDPAESETP